MTRNFNIRDNIWDSLFPHHSIYSDTLTEIANSLNICLSKFTNYIPTRYMDNQNDLNSVINLMFLHLNSEEFDNHTIYPEWRMSLDYALLIVKISIFKEHIQTRKQTIIKNNKEERSFIAEIIKFVKRLNIDHIEGKEDLEQLV